METKSDRQATYEERYARYKEQIEKALPFFIGTEGASDVEKAARYSLMAGGKRIRPVLFLATADVLGRTGPLLLPFACGIEMIHTYSLIHDDLPCMDDDDLRRGRPTCHKVYGEGMAVLAGDFLLNRAFETLLDAIDPAFPETLKAARLIARAAGGSGMIGGQAIDLMAVHHPLSKEELERMHKMKTGALLSAPVEAAVILSGAGEDVSSVLSDFGKAIGLAFQIRDDILDATLTASELGKSAGKDDRDGKSTYVTLFGLKEAQKKLRETIDAATGQLLRLKDELDVSFLMTLTHRLMTES